MSSLLDNTNQGIHYRNACAAVKLVSASQVLDLTVDDYDFLTGTKLWTAMERSQVRRVVEAAVYGSLDYLGLPRFAVPAEYVAAAIAMYVHPVNLMTACAVMDGCEWTENVINGVERPLKAAQIFSHVIRLCAGDTFFIDGKEANMLRQLRPQMGI